jgi:hypothetical protein
MQLSDDYYKGILVDGVSQSGSVLDCAAAQLAPVTVQGLIFIP